MKWYEWLCLALTALWFGSMFGFWIAEKKTQRKVAQQKQYREWEARQRKMDDFIMRAIREVTRG
jgi:hypothetical protein